MTKPVKRINPEGRSQIKKRKGRLALKLGLGPIAAMRIITTAVAAAASVPSSLTSTKAGWKERKRKRKSVCVCEALKRNHDWEESY